MSQARILVIDDDAGFANAAVRGFVREGFDSIAETSADCAVGTAKTYQPDYILLDLNLGETSGLRILPELLNTLPEAGRLVILTGYSSIATAVEATRLGAHDYLCKPARLNEILASLLGQAPSVPDVPTQPPSVERLKWEHIQRVLQEHNGNISATARALSMHRRTLQRILSKRPVAR